MWESVSEEMRTKRHAPPLGGPPACFDELLHYARRLGKAYGTFVRVDLYASEEGAVFGELAAAPAGGKGLTRYADEYLERLWRAAFPEEG